MKKYQIEWIGAVVCEWLGAFNTFDFMYVWMFCALVLGIVGVAERWGK